MVANISMVRGEKGREEEGTDIEPDVGLQRGGHRHKKITGKSKKLTSRLSETVKISAFDCFMIRSRNSRLDAMTINSLSSGPTYITRIDAGLHNTEH